MGKAAGRWTVLVAVAMVATSCTVWTWGYNASGQLGDGSTTNSSSPISLGEDYFSLSAGADHTCRISSSRVLQCWGDNSQGQLGDGTTTDRPSPVQIGTDTDWQSVSAGGSATFINSSATCAIKTNGTLWCWGDGLFGQLGHGDDNDRLTPTQVGTGTDWVSVSIGGGGTCAVRGADRDLWCWGSTNPGGVATNSPTAVSSVGGWKDVSMGTEHGCAIVEPGDLYCWGSNDSGQLGDGTTTDRPSGVQVGTASDWVRLGLGAAHSCATRGSGSLWCWGSNTDGQIGDGTTTQRNAPVQVGAATDWTWITAGGNWFPPPLQAESGHTCGIRAGGNLYCWGDNAQGQLGDGTTSDRTSPTQVGTGTVWVTVDAGRLHTASQEL